MNASLTMTDSQRNEIFSLKQWRPFMICYGALNPQTGEFVMGAVPTMRKPNDLARKGWHVEVANVGK